MTPSFPNLRDLIADWQQRLRDCRLAIRAIGDHHPRTQLLLIHERVLSYLITRYQRARDSGGETDGEPPTVSIPLMQRRFPIGSFCWYEFPKDVEPSPLHPPRSPAELRAHLLDIHTSLTTPPPRRNPWLLLWRPRSSR